MEYKNTYTVISSCSNGTLRRASDDKYMAAHGLNVTEYEERDWGFNSAYTELTTEWVKL